jgi:tetratricopeptide (TPR) repeat protein
VQEPESYLLEKRADLHGEESIPAEQTMVTDILIRAGSLARRGDLLEAENLLTTLSDSDNTRIEVIDLIAKVYAQQGKIDQAQAMWLQALQRYPSNTHYLSALKLCASCRQSRFEQFVSRYLWLLLVVVLWFLIAVALILSTTL